MTPGELIGRMAAEAYKRGHSPVDVTGDVIACIISETLNLDADSPAVILTARRVMGNLCELGWTMPGGAS